METEEERLRRIVKEVVTEQTAILEKEIKAMLTPRQPQQE